MHPAVNASLVWAPDYVQRIASFLEPNEAACLRFVNKATAQLFAGLTIRLSQPVPRWAFQQRWALEGSCRALPRTKRLKLLELTARSDDVANLELALAAAGVRFTHDHLVAAAAAGAVLCCIYIANHLPPGNWVQWPDLAHAAAKNGHGAVVTLCLENCGAAERDLVAWVAGYGAAEAGHVALLEAMLAEARASWKGAAKARAQARADARAEAREEARAEARAAREARSRPSSSGEDEDEEWESEERAVEEWEEEQAEDHAAVLSLLARITGGAGEMHDWSGEDLRGAMSAAVYGSSPVDWAANAELVLAASPEMNYAGSYAYAVAVQSCADVVPRFEWLKAHGFKAPARTYHGYLGRWTNPAALRWLLAEGAVMDERDKRSLESDAMRDVNMPLLNYMHQEGWALDPTYIARWSAIHGHLSVLQWVWDAFGWTTESPSGHGLTDGVFTSVCRCGCVEAMRWVYERRWPEGLQAGGSGQRQGQGLLPSAWAEAALSGCEAAVELLGEWGCPVPADGDPYLKLSESHDHTVWSILPVLHRMGVPLGPAAPSLLARCVDVGAPLPTLEWLLAEGCPVTDWDLVEQNARGRWRYRDAAEVEAWVQEQRPRRRRRGSRSRVKRRRA
ncbi:hypothetical protein HYH03_007877 [Edaphochlamys debaryana]|uniref:Uncharacterized protein n=1 Tax=Edaphochlamys debaryana TaxID=47281 RepID=A0A836BZH4_9CHLO|nr:hypothetical protein HYH03_007877 [Edaphochlamys debaryana]|eukprot:KAG2493947.1 hypothetical protein HYH03_007877 [Edaphochlamys debaryana]